LSVETIAETLAPRGFRRGEVVPITYSGFARCGGRIMHRVMFGPTPDEVMRDVLHDLGLGPREIVTRVSGDDLEIRGDPDEFGPGVLFAIIWAGLAKPAADAALRDLVARDWVPMPAGQP
jgi:hypothetical protein